MVKLRLSLLKGKVAYDALISDAEHMKKLPKEKIPAFLKWVMKFRVYEEAYTPEKFQKFTEMFRFSSIEEFIGAMRFSSLLLTSGSEIKRPELITDFNKLGFEEEQIKLIMNTLESIWPNLEDWLKRRRKEAIPVPSSLRWRVDLRYSSSDYLKKPEVIALLRIGTNDMGKMDQIYMELDKDKLSWLETVIGNIKRDMLKAEDILSRMDMETSARA